MIMTEKEFLIQSFRESFANYRNKRMVIYGISENTEILLKDSDYPILGLMDGYRSEGEIYGKRILSYDDVVKLNIDLIVVVARAVSVKIITARIAKFCKENRIELFDVNGNNLLTESEMDIADDSYFNVSKYSLLEEIDKHDVISFDIFDTLLMRKLLYPTDVFYLIERRITKPLSRKIDFVKERLEAEHKLLSGSYPSIDMIYETLREATGLTDEEADYLKEMELSIEEEVIVPRHEMVSIFQYACDKGKDVYLISDMHITKDYIGRILKKRGVVGFRDLLVSCEFGTAKTQQLFGEFGKMTKGKACLHIGDDDEADIRHALKNGMDTFFVSSARHMLSISAYREILKFDRSFSARIMIGAFAEKIFNDPFALYHSDGKSRVQNSYDIGYLFIAPLISSFVHWLIQQFENAAYDKVLFLARDGYLLEKLYNWAIVQGNNAGMYPAGIYFLTSRIACFSATLYRESDILHGVSVGYDGSPEELLENRFLLKTNDIKKFDDNCINMQEYILYHKEKILAASEARREAYERYICRMGVQAADSMAIVDFAAAGTCQRCLQELIQTEADGYYLLHIPTADERYERLNINSFYKMNSWLKKDMFINESYMVLESILTSFEPTLKGFDFNGDPVFLEEKRDTKHMEDVRKMQEGIIDYFKQYWTMACGEPPEAGTADRILSLIKNRYTDLGSVCVFNDTLQDEFFNRTYGFNAILE